MGRHKKVKPIEDSDEESDEENNTFSVEKLLEKKIVKGRALYLVKWLDYESSENSWEPIENLSSCKGMVDDLEKKLMKPRMKENDGKKQVGKNERSKLPDAAERKVVKRAVKQPYADKIIGITDAVSPLNPDGAFMVLVGFSDDSAKLVEKSIATEKYPMLMIHFYETHIHFTKKDVSPASPAM